MQYYRTRANDFTDFLDVSNIVFAFDFMTVMINKIEQMNGSVTSRNCCPWAGIS